MKKVQLELKALKTFDHPNIIKLLEIKETLHFMFLIIEYCSNGDLLQHVQNKERLDEVKPLLCNTNTVLIYLRANREKRWLYSDSWFKRSNTHTEEASSIETSS